MEPQLIKPVKKNVSNMLPSSMGKNLVGGHVKNTI